MYFDVSLTDHFTFFPFTPTSTSFIRFKHIHDKRNKPHFNFPSKSSYKVCHEKGNLSSFSSFFSSQLKLIFHFDMFPQQSNEEWENEILDFSFFLSTCYMRFTCPNIKRLLVFILRDTFLQIEMYMSSFKLEIE